MEKLQIRPGNRTRTNEIKEKNSCFVCPSDTVMTGRCHLGDENGITQYEYSTIVAYDESNNVKKGTIKVVDIQWSAWIKENEGVNFESLGNRVIVGREHKDDEKGKTRYATGRILFDGNPVILKNAVISSEVEESKGIWVVSDANSFMVGRKHFGDENGNTHYTFSQAYVYTSRPISKAPNGTIIIPDVRKYSHHLKESSLYFVCPANSVLTGCYHGGDEKGTTVYQYSSLKAVAADGTVVEGEITIENFEWATDDVFENIGNGFDAPYGKVIVGRIHKKDEQGKTHYAIGNVYFNGHPVFMRNYHNSSMIKESSGTWFRTDTNEIITSRHHNGDENDYTYYGVGTLCCEEEPTLENDVIINVILHSAEEYFPMNPDEYVRLCRVRQHVDGETDLGYNKVKQCFVEGNDNSLDYYDISMEKISKFRNQGKFALFNLRPFDSQSIKKGELFLQPYAHLHGYKNPNKRVASIRYIYKALPGEDFDVRIDYWLFFGYNSATLGNHEGDWEVIHVYLDANKKILRVGLSNHKNVTTYDVSQLNVIHGEKDELTVYCDNGTHALSNKSFPTSISYKATNWTITDKVISLSDPTQLWKYFAGGWGEIGNVEWTTGPLGPWYKCEAYIYEYENSCPSTSDLVKEGELLLKLGNPPHGPSEYEKKSCQENSGQEIVAENNRILYTVFHSGDETATTNYIFAKLTPTNHYGVKDSSAEITVTDQKWTEWHKESESGDFFITSEMKEADRLSRVLTARQHKGGENGTTRYQTAVVWCNGKKVRVVRCPEADIAKRANWNVLIRPKENYVIIGITHTGDENEITTFCQGYIIAE